MTVLLVGIAVLSTVVFLGLLGVVRPELYYGVMAALWDRTPLGYVRARLVTARGQLTLSLGPWGAYALLVLAGIGATLVVAWPFGWLAFKAGQDALDWPVYLWVAQRRFTGEGAEVMAVVTQLGDRPMTRLAAVIAAATLVLLARHRRWVPVVLILTMFVTQYWAQLALGDLVGRGHPPGNPGTYPSGSTMRLLAQTGFCLFLIFQYAKALGLRFAHSPRWVIAAFTLVASSGVIQGYSRVELMRHWITDVIGGWLVSLLLLATFSYAALAVIPWATARAGRTRPSSGRDAHRSDLDRAGH